MRIFTLSVTLLACLLLVGCDDSSNPTAPQATAGFSFNVTGFTVQFFNDSAGAMNYQWDFGDNSSRSTEFEPLHTYAEPGSYTVRLLACPTLDFESDDCGSARGLVTITGV